jgi:transposase
MSDSDLLHFTPVPVRGRRDGWTDRRQYFFILALARGDSITKAAALLGMSRKAAYALRARPGAEGFAAAWDSAQSRAAERRLAALPPTLAQRALHGEWHPRFHQGQLIGWDHKPANARLVGLQKRLDRHAGKRPTAEQLAAFEALTGARQR